MRLKQLLPLLFAVFSFFVSHGQLSTKHYIPPITVGTGDPIGDQFIYISTPEVDNVAFTITPVGGTVINGVVSNSTPYRHDIAFTTGNIPSPNTPLFQDPLLTSTVNNNKGYIIEAEDVIYVSVRFRQANGSGGAGNHAGALVSKGLSALGTEFRVGGFAREGNVVFNGSHLTFVSVMATENNTNITFDNIPATAQIENSTLTAPFSIDLDEGESYIVAIQSVSGTGGDPNDLLGALVESDKPIVVNSGSASGTFANPVTQGGRDYGVDQIVDASKVGNEYIFVRGNAPATIPSWENILIIASEDNTNVFVNDSPTPEATLNTGEWVVIEGNGILGNGNGFNTNGNMYVQTSNPVFAYQGVGGADQTTAPFPPANQGMFFVPPLSCENRGDVNNIAQINRIGNDTFDGGITIVTNRDATVTVTEDGIDRPFEIDEGPFDVNGNTGYVTYKINDLSGNVSVTSSAELYCAYFNRNGNAASGSFYSGFPSPPEISFNTNITTLGNCIPNVTLESVNTNLFDSVEWFFDDGISGFVSTGNTTGTITPTQAGNYRLVGTLVCSGATFESQTIPVSLCPDDLDNDLIIDNLDADLDNDGILNCDESRGNVILDFTDINQPVMNFNDGDTDNTYISVTNSTTDFTGDTNSNFVSTLVPGSNQTQSYSLAFNNPSNIEFTLTTGSTHTSVNGETFVLTVGPNTKNITLVDPDDILLIDTDFDGIYESGVTSYNSSEVRFRFNPAPAGATPFRLVANNIEDITFTHQLSNTTESSTLEANLVLTCFELDTDGDGIEDSLDADSDNDGIPDLFEATGSIITLSGIDANLDGLDDVFGGTPQMLTDSDGDGVFDIYDLDSDNDGVYDLFEAGHTLMDTDLDGRVDLGSVTLGMNGWADSLETAPDSFLIGYDFANAGDIDTNGVFNYLDLDSDGDLCSDVTEAGYTDPDGDDLLGSSPVTVNTEGVVTNGTDGYTVPNTDYSTIAPILLNTPFEDVAFCEESTSTITIDSTADSFQWELSTDGGANWSTIVDGPVYSGTTTDTLIITNTLLTYDQHQFRVLLNRVGNTCGDTSNSVTLTVEPLPIINTIVTLRQCDNDTDGFSAFNLFEAGSDISANFMNETFVFYPTENDAINDTNAYTTAEATAYTNQTVTTDTVWARAISNFGCYRIAQVNLIVSTTGLPSTFQRSFTVCDDFLDINGDDNANNDERDGISAFDFSSVTQEVIDLFPASQQLTVTYYRNEADALSESDPIADPSNYRNIGYPNTQQIYIRVDSNLDNDCLGFGPFIDLTVDPVPTADNVNNLELCDNLDDGDGFNGLVQTFDLDSQTPTILGTQNPADFTVTYHTSFADAEAGANAISTTAMYTNIVANQQTIYVRVTDNSTGCFTNQTSFDLIVNQLPVANFVEDLEICDDDSDGSARNGFSQSFDLELQTAGILGTQDPTQFSVTYHASLSDAQAGILPLGSPFSNTEPFVQTIYVRVSNGDTGCANGISNFRVIVNPEPIAAEVSNLSYCDDDLDGDDTNGFVQNIDLDSQIPGILDFDNTGQDEDDYTVTFHETQQDATDGTNALSSPYANTTANQQTIYVRIVNDDTGCVNDDFTFDIVVNPLPDFQVTTPQIVCLNGPELTLSVELPLAVYDYVWTDPSGNTFIGSQINITSGGLYTVTATTTDGTGCSRTREIRVNESIIATITEDDVTIVDDSDNNSITIDTTNLGIGDYEFALTNENGIIIRTYEDDPQFENLEGGFYTILVRDKNGCGVASLDVSVVVFPKFFTPNNDGIKDTWAILGANSTFFPESEVNIFNRFGKVVAQIDIDNPGWDGTFNGKILPSDDYWFSIRLVDRNGVVRTRQGNFSLLRR